VLEIWDFKDWCLDFGNLTGGACYLGLFSNLPGIVSLSAYLLIYTCPGIVDSQKVAG
jgi:hypothetical protein